MALGGFNPTGFPNGTDMKIMICDGGATNADITVTGLEVGDVIQQVISFKIGSSGDVATKALVESIADVTAYINTNPADTAAVMSLSTTTTNAQVLVVYHDADLVGDNL